MNSELKRMRKEAVVGYSGVLVKNMPGETEKTTKAISQNISGVPADLKQPSL